MERRIPGRDWEALRAEIAKIIKEKGLRSADFRQLTPTENWKTIEQNIYQTFCNLSYPTQRPLWLWEYFKLETFSLVSAKSYKLLNKLVDDEEIVWFFVNGGQDKFWFYEGTIEAIVTVIEESSHLDELYVASKKYQWLICLNHHDSLIATGQIMPAKLKDLGARIKNSR